MNTEGDTPQKIEVYLGRLRSNLRGLSDEEAMEIVEELRSHLTDRLSGADATNADVDTALAALGSPEELAREYLADRALARVELSRSPWSVLKSLFRWASLSVAGVFVFLGCFFGYALSAVLMWCAVLKPIFPTTDGLWVSNPGNDVEISFHLGLGTPSVGSREVLGWWIVPIGLIGGYGLLMGTTRMALWCVRRYRRSRDVPGK